MKTMVHPKHSPDYSIIICAGLLILFGFVMLASASANLGESKLGDNYYYLRHQFFYGFLPGLIGFLITLRLYYGAYERSAIIILFISLALIMLIFSPLGVRSGGALRWINFGGISFQPAEFLKLAVVIYFAAWLCGNKDRGRALLAGFMPFVTILALVGAILLLQSSTSIFALIMATACLIYFASEAKLSYLFGTVAVGIAAIAIVTIFTPYRLSRISAYLNPQNNQETSGYHINQALISIGSGGIGGVGLGQSTTKTSYLPEPIGDSIFAVIAEELGFVGASAIIIAFAFLVFRIFLLALRMENKFGQLMLLGFGGLIAMQSFVNIAAISGLIPLTGMPLPFISYGGTSLAVFMTMMGMVANISAYARQ